MPDNGIKFFSKGGGKLDDALEAAIEARMEEKWERPTGANVGRVINDESAGEHYIYHLLSSLSSSLHGLNVVVDCANGASSRVAPKAYIRAGAHVTAIHASPNGLNINENCGSTHMESLIAKVKETGADLGIAHDGDADRCLAVDHEGNVVDGDYIMAILATAWKNEGRLKQDTIVGTVMSNLGFMKSMQQLGINVPVTQVGDRYVLEEINNAGFVLGGEQSGHIADVGFDLYMRMVGEAVAEFKTGFINDENEEKISNEFDNFILDLSKVDINMLTGIFKEKFNKF